LDLFFFAPRKNILHVVMLRSYIIRSKGNIIWVLHLCVHIIGIFHVFFKNSSFLFCNLNTIVIDTKIQHDYGLKLPQISNKITDRDSSSLLATLKKLIQQRSMPGSESVSWQTLRLLFIVQRRHQVESMDFPE
jgi:hypothetical protein